ncbi:MAG: hypothetical protein PHE77_01960 [Candidatus Pacebacteria bacterium]|nr:hypothetical protein [Candidatus Paceibacterota bacterium]
MKKFCLFLIFAVALIGCGGSEERRITALVDDNNRLADEVSSLEEQNKKLESSKEDWEKEKSDLKYEIDRRDLLIRRLALNLSSMAVVNEVASIAVNGDGSGDIGRFGNIFFNLGLGDISPWTKAEEVKLKSLGRKIYSTKEVVVIR